MAAPKSDKDKARTAAKSTAKRTIKKDASRTRARTQRSASKSLQWAKKPEPAPRFKPVRPTADTPLPTPIASFEI